MAPVCSNCGATEFVWVNNLKTGSIGRGSLSLRTGGELSLGTRICRTCGHADLFLKDPAILRQPHTWRAGEFVPITSGGSSAPAAASSSSARASPPTPPPAPMLERSAPTPPAAPPPAPPPPPREIPPAPPPAPPTVSALFAAQPPEPVPPAPPPAAQAAPMAPAELPHPPARTAEAKRGTRRRPPKSKGSPNPVTVD